MDRDRLEALLHQALDSAPISVDAAWLFGSQARGTAGSGSDVDVAVLLPRSGHTAYPGPALILEEFLEGVVGIPVQVVDVEQAPLDLVHRVLRDGRLLVDQDRSHRIRFEVTSRNLWFDLEPILRSYRFPGGAR